MPEPAHVAPVFVLCTERGILERKSILLVETLRRFGGEARGAPVFSYSPRSGRGPADSTRSRLRALQVEIVDEPLNREHEDYPFANKVLACADLAERLQAGGDRRGGDGSRIVFLDSDMLLLRSPAELMKAGVAPIVRPVERRIGGTTGDDEHANYWSRIFRWAGVQAPMRVRTTLGDESILGYWNAGLVAAEVGSGLFARWLERFRGLLAAELVHPMGMTFMDQIALALAVRDGGMNPVDPGPQYNTPVDASGPPPSLDGGLDAVVLAHYHHALEHVPFADPLSPQLGDERGPELRSLIRGAGLAGPGAWLVHRVRRRFA